jgi:spore coat polysaccharide biosynthesis protein SpsF
MTLRNVAIIQARMGSSRFPGKMLACLGGIPLIEWVVRRVQRATKLTQVVLATTFSEKDDPLVRIAASLGVSVFRGSETDVLNRFDGACKMFKATNVIRVCADNPFVDPVELDRLVNFFSNYPCDYACNHQDRLGSGYADGFGAEILSANLLIKLANLAEGNYYKEHVTSYLWDHQDQFNLKSVPAPSQIRFPNVRVDVDTPRELKKLEELILQGVTIESSANFIIDLVLAQDG